MEDSLKIVVTGEVDSGKSTLIGRLLYETGALAQGAMEEIGNISQRLGSDFEFAYLLDSFEEERRNKLTIDTTQVFCKTKKGKRFVFIDVPGHQELLKNMLCGSSYADIAVLVVDVNKSLEQQTRRHLFILKFLGIEQVILALNKMDLAGFSEQTFDIVREEIEKFSDKVGVRPEYFVPLSAKHGENIINGSKSMPWYKGLPLVGALDRYFKKRINDEFRLAVQDIYAQDGYMVAVGEIISGRVKNGEKVNILPLNKERSIEKIKTFNKDRRYASAPDSIGLILDDMGGLKRGEIICKTPFPKVTQEILVKLFCLQPLNLNQNFRFKCATQDTPAWIKQVNRVWDTVNLEPKLKYDSLDETDVAEVIISTETPVVTESYKGFNDLGRFVFKSNDEIHAVGIIL